MESSQPSHRARGHPCGKSGPEPGGGGATEGTAAKTGCPAGSVSLALVYIAVQFNSVRFNTSLLSPGRNSLVVSEIISYHIKHNYIYHIYNIIIKP